MQPLYMHHLHQAPIYSPLVPHHSRTIRRPRWKPYTIITKNFPSWSQDTSHCLMMPTLMTLHCRNKSRSTMNHEPPSPSHTAWTTHHMTTLRSAALAKRSRTVNLCLIKSHGDKGVSGFSSCPQFFAWVFHWLVCPWGLLLNCLYTYAHKNLQIGYTQGTLTHTTQIQIMKQSGGDYKGQMFCTSFYIHRERTSLIP